LIVEAGSDLVHAVPLVVAKTLDVMKMISFML
jgi:hypothetical protein